MRSFAPHYHTIGIKIVKIWWFGGGFQKNLWICAGVLSNYHSTHISVVNDPNEFLKRLQNCLKRCCFLLKHNFVEAATEGCEAIEFQKRAHNLINRLIELLHLQKKRRKKTVYKLFRAGSRLTHNSNFFGIVSFTARRAFGKIARLANPHKSVVNLKSRVLYLCKHSHTDDYSQHWGGIIAQWNINKKADGNRIIKWYAKFSVCCNCAVLSAALACLDLACAKVSNSICWR